MRLGLFVGVWLAGVLTSWQQDDDDFIVDDEYLVEELPGERVKNMFRPRTAKEVMKYAARLADKLRSEESDKSYAFVHDTAIGAPRRQRVAVCNVADITTPKYTFHRPRGFRKFAGTDEPKHHLWGSIQTAKPGFHKAHNFNTWGRKSRRSQEQNRFKGFRKQKTGRHKREVDTSLGENDPTAMEFELPSMSSEVDVKKKKKKKKKKKSRTDAPTTTKKMQKRSKRIRLFMESEELALVKGKGKNALPVAVRRMSKELDNLLKDVESEQYTSPPLTTPTKAKFVPIPKNWQNPPSWKPQAKGNNRMYEEEEATTAVFDWKSYDHPLMPQKNVAKDQLVLKPAPEDWPVPTHPADGIYDWHKAQIRRAPKTRRPLYQSHTLSSSYYNNSLQFSQIKWTQWPTMSQSWIRNKFTRTLRRYSRNFIPYTRRATTHWKWAKAAKEETAMFLRNDMWQTKSWTRNIPTPDMTRLTTGQPLTNLGDLPGPPEAQITMETLQGNRLQQGNRHTQTQYQGYQQSYYANYTKYYNQYYQHYYSRLANKTAAYHYEQNHHRQDKHQASGYYHSQYHYQSQQSRLRPPAYFYSAHGEISSTTKPLDEITIYNHNQMKPTLDVSYRLPNEYAGNDRDLRAPLPTRGYSYYRTRAWEPVSSHYRPAHLGQRFHGRQRPLSRPRPKVHRSIFTAPLQRSIWNKTLPSRP